MTEPERDRLISDEVLRERIRQLTPPLAPQPSRLSTALRHPLASIITTFLLTTAVGTWLTNHFQDRQQQATLAAELRERRRQASLLVADSLQATLNRGYYLYGRYYDAIRDRSTEGIGGPDTLRSRRAAFDQFNVAYESHEIADVARACIYLGPTVYALLRTVSDDFHFLNYRLRAMQAAPGIDPDLSAALYRHRDRLYRLGLVMGVAATDTTHYSPRDCTSSPEVLAHPLPQ